MRITAFPQRPSGPFLPAQTAHPQGGSPELIITRAYRQPTFWEVLPGSEPHHEQDTPPRKEQA